MPMWRIVYDNCITWIDFKIGFRIMNENSIAVQLGGTQNFLASTLCQCEFLLVHVALNNSFYSLIIQKPWTNF